MQYALMSSNSHAFMYIIMHTTQIATRKIITFPEQRTLAGHAPFIVVGINACYVLFFGVGIVTLHSGYLICINCIWMSYI